MRVSPVTPSYLSVQKFSNNKSSSQSSLSQNNQNITASSNVQFTGFWRKILTGDIAGALIESAAKRGKAAAKAVEENIDRTLKTENLIGENGKVKGFLKYLTDRDGSKIPQMKIEKNPDGTIKTMTQFEYVPNSNYRKIAKTQNLDADGNLQWETRYKYSEYGKLETTENFDKDGNFLHRTEYRYNTGFDLVDETLDYNPEGELLNRVKYSSTYEDKYKKVKEIQYFDKSARDDGRIYVFDNDDNLLEIKRYEQRETSFAPYEIKYYPSGKFKSEAKCSQYGLAPYDKKEYYESGVLKYADKPYGSGHQEFYENGKLKFDNEIETYNTGTHHSISAITGTSYAPDGITKKSVLISHPKDNFVMHDYEGSALLEFSPDGKIVKQIKVYDNTRADYNPKHTIEFNNEGNLISIDGNSDFKDSFVYEKLKDLNQPNESFYNVKEVMREYILGSYY